MRMLNEYKNDNIINGGVTSIDCSKSGYWIFAIYDDKPYCVIWNTIDCEMKQLLEYESRVSCLQLSPNRYAFAIGDLGSYLTLWC